MITVVTPATVASSAAMIFVSIPPVPSEVPSVAVDTTGWEMSDASFVEGYALTFLAAALNISYDPHRLCLWIFTRIISVSVTPTKAEHQRRMLFAGISRSAQAVDIRHEKQIIRIDHVGRNRR